MKNLVFILVAYFILMLGSCGSDVLPPIDPTVQAEEDSIIITNYISEIGLTGQDSILSTGVHYVILDSGSGEFIDESDIVDFNYIGMTLNDTIFDTSIQSVADSIRILVQEDTVGVEASVEQLSLLLAFDEDRGYRPLEVTYSASGWPFSGRFIRGFEDGLAASFRQMKVGGRVLIVIPSGQAYGALGSGFLIPPNTVIAFELFPVEVEKQPPLGD